MSIEKDLIIQTGKTKRIDSEDNVKFTLEESGKPEGKIIR